MQKLIYLLAILPLISGCIPCDSTDVHLPPIPDNILAFVPYQNGDQVILEHSEGYQIEFSTTRFKYYDQDYCDHCCEYTYHYEVDNTILSPDYPIFSIQINLSSADSIHYFMDLSIGSDYFPIPLVEDQYQQFEILDSIQLLDSTYYDVFKFKSSENYYSNTASIYVDSLYYNHNFGILKIIMNNEEYYTLYR
ncbi:MAG: hypothetical protein KAI79_19125 [Bacteroidales bacterium]|nr:hypothetical protein [Bacteroidales bacterium]